MTCVCGSFGIRTSCVWTYFMAPFAAKQQQQKTFLKTFASFSHLGFFVHHIFPANSDGRREKRKKERIPWQPVLCQKLIGWVLGVNFRTRLGVSLSCFCLDVFQHYFWCLICKGIVFRGLREWCVLNHLTKSRFPKWLLKDLVFNRRNGYN